MTHLKGGEGKATPKTEEEDSAEEEEEQQQGELKAFEGNREECKLVLVVRTDLGMGKGASDPLPRHVSFPPKARH